MNKLMILIGSLALAGCATGGYNPSYYYNEVQVYNRSGGEIENVRVQVGAPGRALSCEQVSKNALCDDRFGKRRYPDTVVELNWIHPDGVDRVQLLTPHIPIYFPTAFPLRLILEISTDGTATALFEQDEPGRDGGGTFIGG